MSLPSASETIPPRAEIVAAARDSIARGSKSFALASRLFDPATRERAWLLYAWCRRCDDLADGQDHGHDMQALADPQARLALIRSLTAAALAGEPTGEAAFDAIGIVARETAMPQRFIDAHVEGFALDAADWRPRSQDDMLRYCWHVAGVVGCMMAIVMGVPADDEETLGHASDLGLAFQLANIARDLSEDDAIGRCYLPEEWLAEMDIPPGQHMKPHFRPRMAVLAKRLATLADGYEASARVGAARLPFRSRWAVLAAAGIYGDIAREVARRGERAWDHRTVTSRAAKAGWVARALVQAMRSGRAEQVDPPALRG
jgi:phytoene synthase